MYACMFIRLLLQVCIIRASCVYCIIYNLNYFICFDYASILFSKTKNNYYYIYICMHMHLLLFYVISCFHLFLFFLICIYKYIFFNFVRLLFISRETQPNGNLYFPPFPAQSYAPEVHAATYKCALENLVGKIVSRESRIKAGTDPCKYLILPSRPTRLHLLSHTPFEYRNDCVCVCVYIFLAVHSPPPPHR